MSGIWNFKDFGTAVALKDDTGVTLRYDELQALQDQLAEAEGRGELTMMLCENSIGAIAGYAALLNSGHPMLMVSAAQPEDVRKQIMNTYRPGLVFAPRALQDDYPSMRTVRTVDSYILMKTNYADPYPVYPELGQMLTTSGSTGSVKFVRQSRRNILVNARNIAEDLGMTGTERTITTLPLNYTYSLSILGASLLVGASLIVTRHGLMDEEFWDLFENERVTAFHGVSEAYEMLRRVDLLWEDFPDLRLMTHAGDKLSRDLHLFLARYATDHGKRFIPMYGQCEATAGITWLPAEKALEKPGSVGIPVPGGTVELIDEGGQPITGAHIPGEVVYRGENVALGYAVRGEDLIRGDDWHGELHTGDIGEWDEDGYLYITGRLRRFIKIAGHRISLDEIDEMIMNDLHIRCVSSGSDGHLVIFALKEEEKAAVQEYVRRKISVVRPVFRVVTIDAFPINEAGKVMYGKLQEMCKQALL